MLKKDIIISSILIMLTMWGLGEHNGLTSNSKWVNPSIISLCQINKELIEGSGGKRIKIEGQVQSQSLNLSGLGLTTVIVNQEGCIAQVSGINETYNINYHLSIEGAVNAAGFIEADSYELIVDRSREAHCFNTTLDSRAIDRLNVDKVNIPQSFQGYWNRYLDKQVTICYINHTVVSISLIK